MPLLPAVIGRPANRLGAVAQNALEVVRFGGLETDEEASTFDIVAEENVFKLRRYFPDGGRKDHGPPVVLVPPMMLAAEVYDVSRSASAVKTLHENGVDPWVIDFGAPEREEGGLERNLTDHVLGVSEAVDVVREHTGRDLHLGGYSQGGMFCYQTAAYRRSEGISSLITFGSPVDTRGALPLGIPEQVATRGATFLADQVLGRRPLPAWVSRTGFRLLDPAKSLRQRLDFVRQLHDREALLPRERQRRFLMGEGWVAWPGPALADFVHQFVAHNRMLVGGFVIDERLVTLADISSPILSFVGEVDEIAPAPAVRAITRAAPRAEVYEVALRAGHFGLVVGSTATERTWPVVAAWMHWRDGDGRLPKAARRLESETDGADNSGPGVRYGIELAAGAGAGVVRSLLGTAGRTISNFRELTEAAASQLPRLNRLERMSAGTRISLGLLLDEEAERSPEDVNFLWEDRAYTHAEAKYRIDAVVRGLLSLGVRQGEHVGVLMETRPSALSVIAALNRLGAVAVLMRPDGPMEREAELGRVERIITDPQHAAAVAEGTTAKVLVLGGGGEPRDLGIAGVIDMERIDPDAVTPPGWYRANPGRASDLAFVVFTGEGERTRAKAITNARWVVSAFGTASSAALSPADTVYSVTPVYHPSGLLMTMGGAIAGGARIALAREFDPKTFWEEVRRYGATVVSYTWTLLHDVVEAPPDPGEHHHPVRIFMGSGMPRGMWRRVNERFAPARVLEFYASTEGDAVLVNLSGAKPGCKGRPLPGSTEVRLARWDVEAGRLVEGRDGFAIPCENGEVGILLARVRPDLIATTASPLRGVFEREDAWLSTGDLFRRDEDGDYWMVDHAPALIRTAHGIVASFPIQDALGDVEAVDLPVVYGVPGPKGKEIAIAAVTLREGRELRPGPINEAFEILSLAERPDLIRVVPEIPVTTWFRPLTRGLRADGIPKAGGKRPVFALDRGKGTYRRLTDAARRRLTGEKGRG